MFFNLTSEWCESLKFIFNSSVEKWIFPPFASHWQKVCFIGAGQNVLPCFLGYEAHQQPCVQGGEKVRLPPTILHLELLPWSCLLESPQKVSCFSHGVSYDSPARNFMSYWWGLDNLLISTLFIILAESWDVPGQICSWQESVSAPELELVWFFSPFGKLFGDRFGSHLKFYLLMHFIFPVILI